ncbi:HSF-type DNA-binding-domain-containing protein [Phakopsora pachyrhizi]|nr:HSF-type DNA-binding-domain-containing protein [Phakopsora pachyrhizi]KAI8449946.1 HSF-type DNA-binding-domain-containing protein [Phakopsora pachyrhizi]
MWPAYSTTGLPVLPHPYEYNDGVQSSHNNPNQGHSINVDINNIPTQQSPHSNSQNLTNHRNVSGHSNILQPTTPIESCHTPQFAFNQVSLSQPPYQHNFNNSGQYYSRPEHAGYISSPATQAVPNNSGIPYISKTHHMASSSRRSNTNTPCTDLIPLTNRLRIDSSSNNQRPGSFSPMPIKSDISDGPEPPLSLENGPPSSTAFISKLYHLCSNSDYRAYIRWNTPGDAFVLAHANNDFASMVLPRFFRHSNVSSFIRQLNLYNFTRLPTIKLLDTIDNNHTQSPASSFSGFSHPYFKRGDENSLRYIKPKPNKNKTLRKVAKGAGIAEDKISKSVRRSLPPTKPKA